jgi:hypothetical protein
MKVAHCPVLHLCCSNGCSFCLLLAWFVASGVSIVLFPQSHEAGSAIAADLSTWRKARNDFGV